MELRHLRYFVAVGEEEHFGRAAQRLRVAQPALSRQIQDLERETGFQLFDRLSRGVKISAAGKSFLEEARQLLHQLNEATNARNVWRAANQERCGSDPPRILMAGCGTRLPPPLPRALSRRRTAAEPAAESATAGGRSIWPTGCRVHVNPPKPDRELDQLPVAVHSLASAAPAAHPLCKFKNLRLRDMTDARFIWFPRRESAAFYDRLMYECFRGGLKSPRIVQEASNEATILTLVAQGMGVGFVGVTARWRCPDGVAILKVSDLKLSLPLALVWRKDNLSPLLPDL